MLFSVFHTIAWGKMAATTPYTPRKECEEISLDGIPADRCANCGRTFEGTMGRKKRNIFGTDKDLSSSGYSTKQAVESLAGVAIFSAPQQRAVFVCQDCFLPVKSFVVGSKKTQEAKQKFQEAGKCGFLNVRYKRGHKTSRDSPMAKKPRKKLFSPHKSPQNASAPTGRSTIRVSIFCQNFAFL